MPGTSKVVGSNMTGPVFFSNGKYSVSQKIVGSLFVCLWFVGLVVIL